ncbi:MAG: DUF1624 domain-containing protein [Candidatus Latescibacterota bacterium]|nr:MAG: DUF1624 domain-containing protein [Candidatus Latescibacterota bacterium]
MGRSSRFLFIDQFRGLVGVLMLLGHSSYYFNAVWKYLDPIDPVFDSWPQFALRYMGYLCAPGFLMMNGAMVWYSYTKRREGGDADWSARWHLIQRGLFLVLVQMTWVNSSWGGFAEFKPGHLGIIACIGLAMAFLTFFVDRPWQLRLGIGLGLFAVHPLLLRIPYDPAHTSLRMILMQTFVDSGEFNKYPVIPWLGLATMGSVMAEGWIRGWQTTGKRLAMGVAIGVAALLLATLVRSGRGYGNLFPFTELGAYSFFIDQKYPPSLYHNLWFFGSVVLGVAAITWIGSLTPRIAAPLGIVGRVPLFFYCVHIGILGIFSKRIGIYYREGGVAESLIGCALMLVVMLPLAAWFGGVKQRSKNYFIRLV